MKLRKVKSLEAKVWLLCKAITRASHLHKCISCKKEVEGKQLHTGHYARKKFVPLQIKYRLDILRPQCSYCNLRMGGNLEWYTIGLMREGIQPDWFINLGDDIEKYKQIKLSVPEQREFLLTLEKEYTMILSTLPEVAKHVS